MTTPAEVQDELGQHLTTMTDRWQTYWANTDVPDPVYPFLDVSYGPAIRQQQFQSGRQLAIVFLQVDAVVRSGVGTTEARTMASRVAEHFAGPQQLTCSVLSGRPDVSSGFRRQAQYRVPVTIRALAYLATA